MKHEKTPEVVLFAMLLGAAGCVSSDLASEPRDPANPAASSALPPARSPALTSGFDPFQAYGKKADSSGEHEHATNDAAHAAHAQPERGDVGTSAEPKGNVIYVCPMHPEVQRTEPGRCPKCGMPLEVRKAGPK
jgi:hypothetical protein